MADSRDILTLAEGKRAVGLSEGDNVENDTLAVYITASSRLLDQHVGPTVALAVTNERHDGITRNGRWRHTIVLRHRPVLAVGSVVEWNSSATASTTLSSESIGTAPANAYLLDPYDPDPNLFSGFVRRRESGVDSVWEWGRQNVVFTYTAGRTQSTTSVDPRFKHACALVLENLWRDRQVGVVDFDEYQVPKASFPTFALPNAVRQLLAEEMGEAETWGAA